MPGKGIINSRLCARVAAEPGNAGGHEFRFTYALLTVDAPLGRALLQVGWKESYRDGTAVLLAGPVYMPNATAGRGTCA